MRKYGLIGRSLDHSWSKDYFQAKFLSENIADCAYVNLPLTDLEGLRDMVHNDIALSGLNVTTPFKIDIVQYLDELDPLAASIGAVNCINISRPGNHILLKGYNTDMKAFRDSLVPFISNTNKRALVLGTGGASRAVCHALKELDIDYRIVSRKRDTGLIDYASLDKNIIANCQIIINATPAGMFPNKEIIPIPYQYLTDKHFLYDLVYNPEETKFLKKGAEKGARVKNGLEMLQRQAELSWGIWNKEA